MGTQSRFLHGQKNGPYSETPKIRIQANVSVVPTLALRARWHCQNQIKRREDKDLQLDRHLGALESCGACLPSRVAGTTSACQTPAHRCQQYPGICCIVYLRFPTPPTVTVKGIPSLQGP